MSEQYWEWDDAIVARVDSGHDTAHIETTDAYKVSVLSRMGRAYRYRDHPAIDYNKLMRQFTDVGMGGITEDECRRRFAIFEITLCEMLEELAAAAWEGASPEDWDYRYEELMDEG